MASSSSTALLRSTHLTPTSPPAATPTDSMRPAVFMEFHRNWPEPLIAVLSNFKNAGGKAVLFEDKETTLAPLMAKYRTGIAKERAVLESWLLTRGLQNHALFTSPIATSLLKEAIGSRVEGQDTEYEEFIANCMALLNATPSATGQVDVFIRGMHWLREATARMRLHTEVDTLKLAWHGIDKPFESDVNTASTLRRDRYMADNIIRYSTQYNGAVLVLGLGATHYRIQSLLIEKDWAFMSHCDWIFINQGPRSSLIKNTYKSHFTLPAEEKDLQSACPLGLTVIYPPDSKSPYVLDEIARRSPSLFSKITPSTSADPKKADFQHKIASIYAQAVHQDDPDALDEFKTAEAQYHIGRAYLVGAGVRKNEIRAAAWFSQAANQGHADALAMLKTPEMQYHLGVAYLIGSVIAQDKTRAAALFAQAAEQGYSAASKELKLVEIQYHLGIAYSQGLIVTANKVYANAWFRQAADNGHALAQAESKRIAAEEKKAEEDKKEATVDTDLNRLLLEIKTLVDSKKETDSPFLADLVRALTTANPITPKYKAKEMMTEVNAILYQYPIGRKYIATATSVSNELYKSIDFLFIPAGVISYQKYINVIRKQALTMEQEEKLIPFAEDLLLLLPTPHTDLSSSRIREHFTATIEGYLKANIKKIRGTPYAQSIYHIKGALEKLKATQYYSLSMFSKHRPSSARISTLSLTT